ncbi:patellin-3-like protein [Carex littledalei]|uniref:Patellin-3-like protein n=1 Tax=Carex littledalei TaxID=544730 RepID=A0A833VB72_9POAL|nr:patellin-3-like protein [Carex littledalei]
MAQETAPPTSADPTPPPTDVVIVPESDSTPQPPDEKPALTLTETPASDEKKTEPEKETKPEPETEMPQSVSFKEESNLVSDLSDPEKKALEEFKQLIQSAIKNREFDLPPPSATTTVVEQEKPKPEETKAEEPKAEESKTEEPKAEESKTEEVKIEETKEEEPKKEEIKTEESVIEEPKAEEKEVVIEEDGAKTVEAIEETVVPVSGTTTGTTPEETEVVAKEEAAPAAQDQPVEAAAAVQEEVRIWGVPLVGDECTDTVLLKFLRAREFKVKDAMTMLKNAVLWRKQFGIESLLEEDLDLQEMNRVVFTCGTDRENHPVCYNVYGEFQNKDLYEKAFGDEEKRQRFLKWRIQYLEKGIMNQLDFKPSGVCSMVQVTDLKNSPSLGKHRQVTKQALTLFQDNYPEFIAKKVFINVPWWYLAVNQMMSPFLTQRTKSKFVFAGPSKSAETLFKHVAPEQVPVQFGGLYREDESDFTVSDAVTEVTIKPSSKHTIDLPLSENSMLVWELRVLGAEVSYGAEFVPEAEGGYTVIVQKTRKLTLADEPIMKASYKTGETGKVVLTIDNTASKKKKLLYRTKTKCSTEE